MNVRAAKLNSRPDSVARSISAPKPGWREQVRSAFRSPTALLDFLGLDNRALTTPTRGSFGLLVPETFARRMRPGDPQDPLLRQVLPDPDEIVSRPGFDRDPVGDLASLSAPAILHKYQGRALLMLTGACAVHCRYCFRQHFPYSGETASGERWAAACRYLAQDESIDEVIFSGGDPLMLSTDRLAAITADLGAIGHIRRLRIHTRMPVILPDRVNPSLLRWLDELPWPVILVIHANHPAEFDREVDTALDRLKTAGVHLLNQAVLLRGINDRPETLKQLMERGFTAGVLPYYLHQLDRVAGSARFEVDQAQARTLIEHLRASLPGYLVPRLVVEQAGQPSKTPLVDHAAKAEMLLP